MARFKYRFEGVLSLRKREEETIQRQMSPLVSTLNRIQTTIDRLHESERSLSQRFVTLCAGDKGAFYGGILNHYRSLLGLNENKKRQVESQLRPWREKLRKAIVKRKALDMLKERDHRTHRQALMRKEQRAMDDLAMHSKT